MLAEEGDNLSQRRRASADTQQKDGDNGHRDDDQIHPIIYYSSIFLILTTLLQIISSYQDAAGPIDKFAELLIPHLASMGFKSITDSNEAGIDGNICPPDSWADSSFDEKMHQRQKNVLYSPEFDPRIKISRPSLFPHCALSRWVNVKREQYTCPPGEEYVTIIQPPNIKQPDSTAGEGRIPKILHVSAQTNCLPSSIIHKLRLLIHQHISTSYTIYIHSYDAMDNFLYQREWDIYPEMKEGVLCGMEKLKVATNAAMKELKVIGNHTQHIADEISLGVRRDIWRYMILWEYGGFTMDIDALNAILAEDENTQPSYDLVIPKATNTTTTSNNTDSSTSGGYKILQKLTQQWTSTKSDALLYFINNVDKQRLPYVERIPLTDIMGSVPNHPLIYYSAKAAFRIAIWDNEVSYISASIHAVFKSPVVFSY